MAKDRTRYQKALRTGLVYNERGQWAKAMTAFRIALEEFSKDPEAFAGLGEACLGLKELDRALDCYKRAARYSQGRLEYMRKVADIQERMGQLSEAGRTYMAIGEILLRDRNLDEAIGNWERAIRLESSLLGAHKRLAMVFQRQRKTREAVREYLAIARILQMRGEKNKALQMCQAALRLDPENEDVLKAVELIRFGEEAFETPEVQEEPASDISAEEQAEADRLTETVRQMAAVFESERQLQPATAAPRPDDPITAARRLAQEQLAEEIFREEEDDEDGDEASLTKLERDALLGQGMDSETRGRIDEAIDCYSRAIAGGMKLPAVYFILGMLYLENNQKDEAKRALRVAAQDVAYRDASQMALADM